MECWWQGTSLGPVPEASTAGELSSLGKQRQLSFGLRKMSMNFSGRGSSVLDVSVPAGESWTRVGAQQHVRKQQLVWQGNAF